MMFRTIARRLKALEDRLKSPPTPVPNVVHVRVQRGERQEEAMALFRERYPERLVGHRVLVVPTRDRTIDDENDFDLKFKAQQLEILRTIRSNFALETEQ